jgi:hypothetical protein
VLALLGIGITILWPEAKVLGWIFIFLAGSALCLWLFLEFVQLFGKTRKAYIIASVLSCLVIGGLIVAHWKWGRDTKIATESKPEISPATKPPDSTLPAQFRPTKHPLRKVRPASSNVCTPTNGTRLAGFSDKPGGAKLETPMLMIDSNSADFAMTGTLVATPSENGGPPVVVPKTGGDTIFLFQMVLTNRGESTIAKDWKLCVVRDRKPVFYDPIPIPANGIELGDGRTITPSQSLVDFLIRNPVEHAHTAGGWIAFKVPGMASDFFTLKKVVMDISLRDYLDRTYFFDLTVANPVIVDKQKPYERYVPGGTPPLDRK